MNMAGKTLVLMLCLLATVVVANATPPAKAVLFPSSDGGIVDADLYGHGVRGVVLAHGAAFDKKSWAPLASRLVALGYSVLAIDFRGYGRSRGGNKPDGLDQDVIGAVRWLHAQGVKPVSVLGGSMGGGAAAEAATEMKRGELAKLILLSPVPIKDPERIDAGSILYIASRNEALEPEILDQYGRAPKPKKIVLLPGSAHAQNIFATPQSARLTAIILQFLASKPVR